MTITSDTRPVADQPRVAVPETTRSRNWLSIVDVRSRPETIGVVMVVALVVIGMVLFVGRDGAGRNQDFSPRDAVASFLTAAKDADMPAARNAVCSGMTASDTDAVVRALMSQLKDFRIERTTAHGNQADVDIQVTTVDGEASGATILATRQAGSWKVCDLAVPPSGVAAGS